VRPRDGRRHGTPVTGTREFSGTRSVARKLALQALYRWQLNACPWQDLVQEFGEAEDMPRADQEYFRTLVEGVWREREPLDARLASLSDREPQRLDPIEHAILLIGLYELSARQEVPYRVAINEAVMLAKRFGATDGHKFVNAVMDRAARELRPAEH
jgi:transcription antitermination protein NusB